MSSFRPSSLALIAALGLSPTAGAVTFILDTQQSALTLSGNATFTAGGNMGATLSTFLGPVSGTADFTAAGSGTVAEQGTGSLTTALYGQIDAHVSGSTLSIDSATVTPAINGNWRPDVLNDFQNSAQAQFGSQITPVLSNLAITPTSGSVFTGAVLSYFTPFIESQLEQTAYAALRSSDFGLTGASLLSGNSFPVQNLIVTFSSGTLHFGGPAVSGNALDFSGASSVMSSATGTYSDGVVVDTLIIPISISLVGQVPVGGMGFSGVGDLSGSTLTYDGSVTSGTIDMNLTLAGNLVAATQPVPEPETWAMLLAGLGLVGFRCRRSRSLPPDGFPRFWASRPTPGYKPSPPAPIKSNSAGFSIRGSSVSTCPLG